MRVDEAAAQELNVAADAEACLTSRSHLSVANDAPTTVSSAGSRADAVTGINIVARVGKGCDIPTIRNKHSTASAFAAADAGSGFAMEKNSAAVNGNGPAVPSFAAADAGSGTAKRHDEAVDEGDVAGVLPFRPANGRIRAFKKQNRQRSKVIDARLVDR